ncbi:MAG: oxidoreductase [Ignavibacteriales bacterium CG18_big_fil_WC_8_21_14_2_50_31_20]|nr:MAG: oxidoreductase [Ignavibacteriales bacterium CG18_big_fil_WC_8_21_14_2_50_31_20]
MKYNNYIKASPKVSEVGFGAWQLGKSSDWATMSEKEAVALVHKALELGINYFDTAPNYGYGSSEERLGIALSETDRSKIVINTKFGHDADGKTNFEADNIRKSLEGSLRRLKTDYLDSIILHNPPFSYLDGNNNLHYEIFERLKEEGKIKAYGASLDTYEEMQKFMSTTKCEVIEAFFNIFHQDAGKAFSMAKEKGVSIVVKIPLDSGWLSGKYTADSKFDDIRKRWSSEDIKTRASLVDKVKDLLIEDDEISQTAIAFCLAYDAVSTVIPGNKSINQLTQNVESVKKPISDGLLKKLENLYTQDIEKLRIPW